MNKESDVDLASPISCLPDDVVLEIFHNKVMDLKTLCLCKLVSKRFYAVVHQVDTIRVFRSHSEFEWLKSIRMFKRLKSVCIHPTIPSFISDSYLGKWKVKLGLNRLDSVVIVSPTSIYKGLLLLYEEKQNLGTFLISVRCLADALLRVLVVWCIMNQDFPLLEKVSVTDSDNRGKVSINGRATIDELRNWKSISFPHRVSECYLPSLKLPVSGYVMKGVTLILVENKDLPDDGNYDRFINNDHEIDYDKRDTKEAAYHEAMMEIFKKHKDSIVRRQHNDEWETGISKFITDFQCLVETAIRFKGSIDDYK